MVILSQNKSFDAADIAAESRKQIFNKSVHKLVEKASRALLSSSEF